MPRAVPAELVDFEGYLRAAMDNAGCDGDMGDGGFTVRVSAGPKRRPA